MDEARQWRAQVVDGLSLTISILVALGMPAVVWHLSSGLVAAGVVLLWSLVMGSWLLRRRLPLWWRAGALMAVGFGAVGTGFTAAGALVVPTLAAMLSVIVARLVFGARGGLLTHLALVLMLLGLGAGIGLGVISPPPADGASLASAPAWAREALGFGIFGAVIFVSIGYVVRRIESALEATSRALEELRREQAEREQAQQALQASDRKVQELQRLESLGRLAGGVAHDFNNSLTILMAGAEELDEVLVEARDREVLDDMRRAMDGAVQLTRQLLAYGRRDVIEPRRLDLGEFLTAEIRALRRVLPDDVRLELAAQGALRVFVDPNQLHHVILNLVLNARDAMAQGGAVTLAAEEEAPGVVSLAVRDTGCGMSDEVKQKALEPFFTTKPVGEGTGLGLSMVAGIVQRWGGRVQIESAPGEGTQITLTLPTSPEGGELAQAHAPLPREARATVLLVEDEALVRRALSKALRKRGHEVLEARSGDEALLLLESHAEPIDALCTDGVMPGTPSSVLIDAFRQRHPRKPVLVCSGYLQEELVRRDIAEGATHFLSKPVTGDQLAARLEALLRGASPPTS